MCGRSVHIVDGALTVPMHVLQMPGGVIPVPNRTTEIFIEVGTNSFDTWDQQLLPKRPTAFLVAFEPLVDKWALVASRGVRSRVAGRLGWHHERGVLLPFAVAEHEGVVPFHVSPRDGCSSLRKVHVPQHGGWKSSGFIRGACAKTVQVRRVPAVTLRTVLGEWLPGRRIARIKIDAQGSDLGVLAAAGAANLARVDGVTMEMLRDTCDALYEGQPNCSTVARAMVGLGFRTARSCDDPSLWHQGAGCEANFLFENVDRPPSPPSPPAGRAARGRGDAKAGGARANRERREGGAGAARGRSSKVRGKVRGKVR